MAEFKPMKAPSEGVTNLEALFAKERRWLISPKIDGYRCVGYGGRPRTSTLGTFANRYLNEFQWDERVDGLDGELVVGPPHGHDVMRRAKMGLTRVDGTPDWHWHLFDNFGLRGAQFSYRHESLRERVLDLPRPLRERVEIVPQLLVESADEVADAERAFLEAGYEGAMLRTPYDAYHCGRQTFLQGRILKLKRFTDDEATVTGIEEGSTNNNAVQIRADGGKKRATRKEGMSPNGLVGTLLCDWHGTPIRVAPGAMTLDEKVRYMREPRLIVGQQITFKFFGYGTDKLPRHPTFKVIRVRGT